MTRRIEIGVTHEVVINHDKAWIRLAISDDVDDSTDMDQAIDALSDKVNARVLDVIQHTVETIDKYEEKR